VLGEGVTIEKELNHRAHREHREERERLGHEGVTGGEVLWKKERWRREKQGMMYHAPTAR
jgi:hypothetical protein